ncbi:hypothetical protein KB221_07430 [Aquidulcibacter paucihalophilus]|nr:hypothetical protein KB221_07430 [Aquidulcibacter paucihalophilus]
MAKLTLGEPIGENGFEATAKLAEGFRADELAGLDDLCRMMGI